MTAFVTWALIEAHYEDTPEIGRAIDYIRQAAPAEEDAYTLALAANALVAHDAGDPAARAVLDALYEKRVQDGDIVYWPTSEASFMGATGDGGGLETTALAAYALLRAKIYPEAVNGALSYLIQAKDSWGTWSTTQATILSLKALLLASEQGGSAAGPAAIRVSLNGEQTQEITVDETNADVVHLVTFDRGFAPSGPNRVQIELAGGGNLMYQVTTRYYLPWDQVPPSPPEKELLTLDLEYSRTTLSVNDELTVNVGIKLNREGVVKLALIDLGVPPGFTVQSEDLSRLVELGLIARYELTGRQVIIYLEDFSSAAPLQFSYRLRARFPMRAQTPPSVAYDYYNPGSLALRAPLLVSVNE
jgi:CD109 antigen